MNLLAIVNKLNAQVSMEGHDCGTAVIHTELNPDSGFICTHVLNSGTADFVIGM